MEKEKMFKDLIKRLHEDIAFKLNCGFLVSDAVPSISCSRLVTIFWSATYWRNMIAGSMSGIAVFSLFDAGLVAGPSPGSIFSYLALTPRGNFLGIILGVLVAAVVSFIITSLILKFDKKGEDEEDLEGSIERSKSMKSEGKQVLGNVNHNDTDNISDKKINKISFVCDAGAGSSALGATTFRKRLKKADIADIEVKHYRIEDAPQDSDIIVVHKDLLDRARMAHNDKTIISIENYIDDPSLVKLVDELKND